MESVNKYCIMKQSMKAKEILKQAELKKSDFINEAVYNTVVGNICKLLTKIDELDECVNFQKNCKHEDTRAYYYREGEYALKICDKCNAHLD
jgi:hypothetical protein